MGIMFQLSDHEFGYIRNRIYNYARINLTEKKRSLVLARLSKRIRKLGLSGFPEYIKLLEDPKTADAEFEIMVDALSTNYSTFFREHHHFQFLEESVFPLHKGDLKIWSAASSSGQEIFSILMSIREYEERHGVRINHRLYASDVSSDILRKACRGVYGVPEIEKLDTPLKKKYFLRGKGSFRDQVRIKPELLKQVVFFKLNLMDPVYKLPLMDVIFLRNVIIYFDQPTKVELMEKMANQLKPGGYLILGHSESMAGLSDRFEIAGKTIYRRKE